MGQTLVEGAISPKKIIVSSRLNRFTNIFFSISIALISIVGLGLLSSILTPLLWFAVVALFFIALVCMVIFSFGTVFVMESKPLAKLWRIFTKLTSSSDSMMSISQFCFNSTQWISLAGMIIGALAIVFAIISKTKFKVLKIVLVAIFMVLFAVVFAFIEITGGVQV
jgi:hypothetical protein